ncbi:MAG: 50S ribosomal protein L18a [Thermoprotei archaeon]|nr:MAG: 50S ribosomal protein L18a [Thermoprotei archaeon]
MEVKVYLIEGKMLIAGKWSKFSMELTGIRKEHVIEKVYSLLGSRHKLKRDHIRITDIKEISPNEVKNRYVSDLLKADKLVIVGMR